VAQRKYEDIYCKTTRGLDVGAAGTVVDGYNQSDRTKPWATRRPRKCTSRRTLTEPSRHLGSDATTKLKQPLLQRITGDATLRRRPPARTDLKSDRRRR